MPQMTAFTGFLTRVRESGTPDARTDAELVRAYADTRSEAAFAELVRRFAPMVWGVCRRTVGHHQHAEDAFQAVFLVLVRRSYAIRPPSAVGGWLHAVAVHTSLRARTMADRRRHASLDTGADAPATSPTDPTDAELIRVLDEEIARLPDKLRVAVVLCELDGLSRRETATRLGIAEGTLSSRLAAARKQLATRLRGRGVTLGVGGIAALVGGGTASAVPPLVASASETVTALAEGAIRTMFLSKLKLTAGGVLAALLLAVVGVTAVSPAAANDSRYARRNAPVPKVEKEGKILFWLDEKPLLLKSDGTELDSPDPIPKVHFSGSADARLSPDGKRVAFQYRDDDHQGWLKIFDLGGKAEMTVLDTVRLNGFHWLGDGKTLYVRGYEVGGNGKLADWVYDPAADKRTPLKVPKDFFIRAVGPDGKTAVADEWKMTPKQWHQHAHLWTIGTDKPTPLLELNQSFQNLTPQFSPDGKRLLCRVRDHGSYTPLGNGQFQDGDFKFDHLLVIDLATKKQTVVKELGEKPEWRVGGYAWSPDGKKVAYVETRPLPPPPPGQPVREPFRVTVCDPDGKNAKEIHKAEGFWLVGFDWR